MFNYPDTLKLNSSLVGFGYRLVCIGYKVQNGDDILDDSLNWTKADENYIGRFSSESLLVRRKSSGYSIRNRQESIDELNATLRANNKQQIDPMKFEFTCDTCCTQDECEWAFDLYNTQGDCLYLK